MPEPQTDMPTSSLINLTWYLEPDLPVVNSLLASLFIEMHKHESLNSIHPELFLKLHRSLWHIYICLVWYW
jgi:hypothetical protein